MSTLEHLLRRTCVLIGRQPSDPLDPDSELDDVELATVAGELQQTTAGEALEGRLQVTGWRLFLPASATLTGWDAVDVDGVRYEIDGDPWLVESPRTGEPHHVEASVRRSH